MDPTFEMTKKRKGKAALDFLRYPGLGFVLDESSPAPAAEDRTFGVHFVPPMLMSVLWSAREDLRKVPRTLMSLFPHGRME